MRMDSSALKFDSGIAQLAMPGDSGLKAASEGIANVGKVFLDIQDREQAAALNALKMEEAGENIKAKQFENSISGEKWEQAKQSHVFDLRNKKIDAAKKQLDYDSEVKKAGDLEVTNQIRGMLPSTMFYKDGKFDRGSLDAARGEFLNSDLGKKAPHLVNAVFDGKLKEIMEAEESVLKNSKTAAEAFKIEEEGRYVAPKARANINQSNASAAASYASANKSNVEASLAPRDMAVKEKNADNGTKQEERLGRDLKKERQKIVADDKLQFMIPEWDDYSDANKRSIINKYIDTGDLPASNKTIVTKKGIVSDDTDLVPVYTSPKTNPATPAKAPATKPVQKQGSGSIPVGTIKTNPNTGQKAQFDGKGWVLVQ